MKPVTGVALLLSVFCLAVVVVGILPPREAGVSSDSRAPGRVVVATVRGTSMEPRIREGERVVASLNTEEIRRDDVVLVKITGLDHYLIKRVAGVPGDRIVGEKDGSKWIVRINAEKLKNSRGAVIDFMNHRKVLERMFRDRGGVIPEGFYFVAGDQTFGTNDSSLHGWISLDEISARVLEGVRPENPSSRDL